MPRPTVIKCVFLGSSGTGKSSIIHRYVTNEWDDNVQTTLGAAFMDKTVIHHGVPLKFQIWDTAGQEKYAPMAQMYYKGAHVAILVYDSTNQESFFNLRTWYLELAEKGPKNIILAVVGNKCDVRDQEQVYPQDGEKYAQDCGAIFMRVSAKGNIGITELFDNISDKLIENLKLDEKPDMTRSKIGNAPKVEESGGCC